MPGFSSTNAPATADRPLILAIQLARLGDFLQTTPLLAHLARRRPHARIAAMVTPEQAPLARRCPDLDEVIIIKRNEINALSGSCPDRRALAQLDNRLAELRPRHIFNLNMSMPSARLAQAWPKAGLTGWRFSAQGDALVGEPWFGFMMNMVADRRLTRHHLSDLLASFADPPGPAVGRLRYQVGPRSRERAAQLLPRDGRPVVALQLGANNDLRRWPVNRFAALADGLIAAGCAPLLIGARAEGDLGRRMKASMAGSHNQLIDIMGKTDLPTLAAVLEGCALVVSNDTGTLHLATAVGAPTLALFMGPAQAHETGPYGQGHLVLQARDICGPCQEQTPVCGGAAPCRRLIAPELVLATGLALATGQSAGQACQRMDFGPGVQALEGVIDRFGQRYRPLGPNKPLGRIEALALALREAGRVLIRSTHDFRAAELAAELATEHLPPSDQARADIDALARTAQTLARAAADGQREAALGLLPRAPELKPLASLVGGGAPRLALACQAATQSLEICAAL
ncbi:glycosyltransferase family 9 protein [Desulfarculus baarsii]